MNPDLREIENVNYAYSALTVPGQRRQQELWKLASLLVREAISGHLVGLCSVASVDSSPRLRYIPRLSALLFSEALKTAGAVFEWQQRGGGAPPSSFSHILFEGANMGPSLQATRLSAPRGTQ